MNDYKIIQGTDVKLQVRVLDGNNLPVVLSTATKIRVGLFVKNTSVYKYADTVVAGYGVCEIDPVLTDTINILLTRDQSKLFPTGALTCSVLVEMPDVDLTVKRLEYSTFMGYVLVGNMKSENL